MLSSVLGVAVAYLLGAMPWALWLGKALAGVDVRERGSGNLGATNVYRVLGPRLGVTVFLLDVAKGALAVLACAAIGGDSFPGGRQGAALAGGAAAVLGHAFTVFAGFRGGKGAATTAGALLALAPAASAIGFGVFALVLVVSRRISVASVSGGIAASLALWFLPAARADLATALVGTVLSLFVILRHLPNLKRLARGEEPTFSLRSKEEP